MNQSQLFTESGEPSPLALGHAAATRAFENAAPQWQDVAERAVRVTCVGFDEFTADNVLATYLAMVDARGLTEPDPRAWGRVMLQAAKNGWCETIPGKMVRSERRSNHGRYVQVWKSLKR